jgi:hypothetical protein
MASNPFQYPSQKGNERKHFSRGYKEDLLDAQNGRCARCHDRLRLIDAYLDHKHALGAGGTNNPRNLQLICPTCNTRKTRKDIREASNYRQRQKEHSFLGGNRGMGGYNIAPPRPKRRPARRYNPFDLSMPGFTAPRSRKRSSYNPFDMSMSGFGAPRDRKKKKGGGLFDYNLPY